MSRALWPRVTLCVGVLTFVAIPAFAQDLELVPGSTVPRVQLTGEHFQIQTDGVYFTAPTQSATLSRFGLFGTDLGRPLTAGDRIILFYPAPGHDASMFDAPDQFDVRRGSILNLGARTARSGSANITVWATSSRAPR